MTPQPLELLAPAKNRDCGIAAINHGADAVYIGGPLFGARAAAANSLADIEQLITHAHRFHARVYVALNTLLNDQELEQAARLAHQLYDLGADALIIQDVGLLETNLPPIALHSSTQMNNRTVEKVRFLEQVGFAQVVLARELSLAEIKAIRAATTVPLECFVHGALCVSFSGQCYISEVVAGRSANRGQCAQFCRHRFDLRDSAGTMVQTGKHLLSLRDLDLSDHLAALIDAGICSFKIEGRLKNEHYVKNVTAAYRLALDAIIDGNTQWQRASSGRCRFNFSPDPSRSFSRGATDYFLTTPRNVVAEIRTPKSIGKAIGRVGAVTGHSFTLAADVAVHNGDGLCFFNRHDELIGLRVNRVEGRTVYPKDGVSHLGLSGGMVIHRNLDIALNKALDQSTLCRTIAVTMSLVENPEGLELTMVDEDSIASSTAVRFPKEKAAKAGTTAALAIRQLQKSGGTIFSVQDIALSLAPDLFVPASVFNDLRRRAFTVHLEARLHALKRAPRVHHVNAYPWPSDRVDYRENVTNRKARAFYRRHGVSDIRLQDLRAAADADWALMTTKYCIKAQLGFCTRMHKPHPFVEPFILVDNTGEYVLEFDCARCEMAVRKRPDS